ncbi:MAG TPA: aminotransferase class V-fold PLP-dependent enzyme [Tepidisphaeraceae bacterium]|jgi:L-seryl-tRNA(Ser) seleniumtransferase|nr:aminotransferase class V-fold PLP-dependent enzyme [Tepidisphaeraceae bacterium]
MNIYEELKVRPFINARGIYTRFGGTIMPEAVVAAMAEASRQFVNLFELQDRMGEAIARMTQNEAAFVSCGAASGILLAIAGCIAGTNEESANRLPDTQGMRNQVIMQLCDCGTECDAAIRAAGGKIVHVGVQDRRTNVEKFLDAINEQTAAIVLLAFGSDGDSWGRRIVEGARQKNIPVLVDGAYSVPPKENLWRYTRDVGVDALITSGGKGIHGPQPTGLVLGKRTIIEGCKFHASPNVRIGRGMKVGKEEFAGVYTALKLFLSKDVDGQNQLKEKQIAHIREQVKDISGVKLRMEGSQLHIDLDSEIADKIMEELLQNDPSILLSGRGKRMMVQSSVLQPGEEQIVGQHLRRTLERNLRQ